ncbi:hypothetical protein SO802_003351 [Lithocarpus litseifolius]|uniref:Thiolase N-terminal domain-containing protein n=1 Tax=Lithocarpus litseifolius TaxID=425828 RepID=A0AAW2DZV5_9ROSI
MRVVNGVSIDTKWLLSLSKESRLRAYRTPICKAKRGGFKDTYADDLLAPVLKAVIEKTNVNPSEVGDIMVGTVLAPGSQRATECRMAAFYAGFPGGFFFFSS